MKKSAAVAGGIFACVALLFTIIGAGFTMFNYSDMGIEMLPGQYIAYGISTLIGILWIVVLLRKKKDIFAGVCFGLIGLYRAYSIIGNIRAKTWLFAVSNLIFFLILAVMAVECFLELPLRRKTKSTIFCLVMALAGVLNMIAVSLPILTLLIEMGMDDVVGLSTLLGSMFVSIPSVFMHAYAGNAAGGVEVRSARRDFVASQGVAAKVVGDPENYGYIGMLTHLLLTFFTFGIWNIVWTYRTTAALNKVPGNEQQSPGGQMLLCMFIPLYLFFWVHKQCKRAENYTAYAGSPAEFATLCTVFAFFFPIVTWIVMQNYINKSALAITGC